MSRNNPLPLNVQQEARRAAKIFNAFADPIQGLDKVIPVEILRQAKGFAILTVVKAGFLFSARAGTGVVVARLQDGGWSAPSAIGTVGGGVGLQAGAEMTEFIIILNSRAAVGTFMATGSLTVGGNMSVAAGPLGRNVEGTGALSSKGKVAAMYSYSRTRGLFGGASLEGSVIVERSDANSKAYGFNVTAKQLLSGTVDVPHWAENLLETVARQSGDHSVWYADDDDDVGRPKVSRGYSFGSPFASGGGAADSRPQSAMRRAFSGGGGGGGSNSSTPPMLPRVTSQPSSTNERNFEDEFSLGSGPMPAFSRGNTGSRSPSPSLHRERLDSFSRNESYSGRTSPSLSRSGGGSLTPGRHRSGSASSMLGKLVKPRSSSNASSLTSTPTGSAANFKFNHEAGSSSIGRRAHGLDVDDVNEQDEDYFGGAAASTASSRQQTSRSRPEDDEDGPPRDSLDSIDQERNSPFADSSATPHTRRRAQSGVSPMSLAKGTAQKDWDDDLDAFGVQRKRASTMTATSPRFTRAPSSSSASPASTAFDMGRMRQATNDVARSSPTPSKQSPAQGGLGRAIAKFDFEGVESGDLGFRKGDVITITSVTDEEWWTGTLGGRTGIFPRNYCTIHLS